MKSWSKLAVAVLCPLVVVAAVSCGSSKDDTAPAPAPGRGSERAGQPCTAASQCFEGVKEGSTIKGNAVCLDRVESGYCTHTCTADSDCCAVAGECLTSLAQVCGPFESTGQMLCFLSCEVSDIQAKEADLSQFKDANGGIDTNKFCSVRAGTDFICRSTGGGSKNRKVCVPGGGGTGTTDAGK